MENKHRWWESYLVRYLAGNIFAVLVLFYLIGFHGDKIQTKVCPDNSKSEMCLYLSSSTVEVNLCDKKFYDNKPVYSEKIKLAKKLSIISIGIRVILEIASSICLFVIGPLCP